MNALENALHFLLMKAVKEEGRPEVRFSALGHIAKLVGSSTDDPLLDQLAEAAQALKRKTS